MTPIKLEWQAFGPFRELTSVDFRELSGNGPFLITGRTGSGKTTILDALCFALYGKGSGVQRTDFEEMRCKSAAWGTDTFVRYTFEINGSVFRFERRLECKMKNLTPSFSAAVRNPDGVFEPLFERCRRQDMDKKAEELLGLSYEQFRQVVILPQGKFEEFLVANPDVKESILSSIFGIDKWQKIANAYFDRALSSSRDLAEKKARIVTTVVNENKTDLEELNTHLSLLAEKRNLLAQKLACLEYEKQKQALSEKKDLCTRFDNFDGLMAVKAGLEKERVAVETDRKKLTEAVRAEKVRAAIDDFDSKTSDAEKRRGALDDKEAAYTRTTKDAKAKASALKAHRAKETEYNGLKSRRTLLEGKRPRYKALKELADAKDTAEKKLRTAESAAKCAGIVKEKADETLAEKYAAFDEANRNCESASKVYMDNVAGSLAAGLADGEACPVCGSTHHPAPAALPRETVTRDRISVLEEEREAARKDWEKADDARKKAEEALARAREAFSEADKAFSAARQKLQQALQDTEPGISTADELEAEIERLSDAAENYEKRLETLVKADTAAREALAAADTDRKTAQNEYKEAEKSKLEAKAVLTEKMAENGFAAVDDVKKLLTCEEERTGWIKRIQAYDTNCKNNADQIEELRGKLAGKERPDRETLEAQVRKLDEERDALTDESNSVKREIERLAPVVSGLNELQEDINAKQAQVSDDLQFAKKLRGDTGIGLQRYVLSVMFKSVIFAANRMLEKVHNGRYQLFDSAEGGTGNKKGLELAVHDSWAPDGGDRSARGLSGGEKFLVSLALSIGLSEIAQKNGTRLGTLFVDEGFGSLDEDSIEDALSVLYSVTKANGTVGIISHVDIVRDSISTKVEVNKASETKGSSLEIVIG